MTRVQDAFYPANDDVIKVYHSNISASRLAVWKGYNDPVIQTGWNFWEDHRDGISIEQLHVIHSRYKRSGEYMFSAQARAALERRREAVSEGVRSRASTAREIPRAQRERG